jgi:hypothetical protein
MGEGERYEVQLANGETELADSLWGARHALARRVAFAADPARPLDVLPARIYRLGRQFFGGRTFAEEILTASELTAVSSDEPG